MRGNRVLLIDDEPILLVTVSESLAKAGYQVEVAENGRKGLEKFQADAFDIVITDMVMPDLSGIEVLREIKQVAPRSLVVMISAYGSIEKAVEAMKLGAHDFITKPFSLEELLLKIQKIASYQSLQEENIYLREQLESRYRFGNLIGKSRRMLEVYDLIKTVAESEATVLIQGESGTGKEVVASALHFNSHRKEGPLVKVSCAALPESLLESEMFGHEKGAFTGAGQRKPGRFEVADRGTLFLDEVGEIPPAVQVKLLRVLQERQFERLGSTKTLSVDVRIISATQEAPERLMEKGKLREDLFYRLNVIRVNLPPLRERKEDIPLLAFHFLDKLGKKSKKDVRSISPEALEVLEGHHWPGNVRELENVIERAFTFCQGQEIQIFHLPPQYRNRHRQPLAISDLSLTPLGEVMRMTEREYLLKVLGSTSWHKTRAAEILGISRKALWEKLKEYDLLREQ